MFRTLTASLLDLFYPRKCPGCKLPRADTFVHETVCATCWRSIVKTIPPFCRGCGRHLEQAGRGSQLCPDCENRAPYFDGAFSPCLYTGTMQELIREFKYKGKDYLGRALSSLLIDFIDEYSVETDNFDAVIPVPLHRARLREREFNQAQIIGENLARKLNLPLLEGILIRNRNTPMQAQLQEEKRRTNVAGSFTVTHASAVNGKRLLLVDDVMTTGSTVSEAAFTLKNKGAKNVYVMTLAH